jgi:hypothetical protein
MRELESDTRHFFFFTLSFFISSWWADDDRIYFVVIHKLLWFARIILISFTFSRYYIVLLYSVAQSFYNVYLCVYIVIKLRFLYIDIMEACYILTCFYANEIETYFFFKLLICGSILSSKTYSFRFCFLRITFSLKLKMIAKVQ